MDITDIQQNTTSYKYTLDLYVDSEWYTYQLTIKTQLKNIINTL